MGQGKKGVRNGRDITGSECSPPVICPSTQDKAFIDKALTVYDFIISYGHAAQPLPLKTCINNIILIPFQFCKTCNKLT